MAGVTELRTSRWRIIRNYFGGFSVITRILKSGRTQLVVCWPGVQEAPDLILSTAQVLTHIPVPPALRGHRQEDQGFMVNLGCIDHGQPSTIWNLVLGESWEEREREGGRRRRKEREKAEEKARMLIHEVITSLLLSL